MATLPDPKDSPYRRFNYYEGDPQRRQFLDNILQGRRATAKTVEDKPDVDVAAKTAANSRSILDDVFRDGGFFNYENREQPVDRPRTDGRVSREVVKDWLRRITYKPDTKIEVMDSFYAGMYGGGSIVLGITRRLPDSTVPMTMATYTDQRTFVPVGCRITVPTRHLEAVAQPLQFDLFVAWLRKKIIWLEQHEIDEWLRVDGQLPYDPHSYLGTEREVRRGKESDDAREWEMPHQHRDSRTDYFQYRDYSLDTRELFR